MYIHIMYAIPIPIPIFFGGGGGGLGDLGEKDSPSLRGEGFWQNPCVLAWLHISYVMSVLRMYVCYIPYIMYGTHTLPNGEKTFIIIRT